MKKLLLLTILFSLFSSQLKADFGSCVVYHAKFYLKNGTNFNACFEEWGYDTYLDDNGSNQFCSDKGVFELFKKQQHEYKNGKVPVYKNLYYVQPRFLRKQAADQIPSYGFVTEEDLVLLDSNAISKMIFWKAEYSKRYWYTSEIIVGTLGMLDTLQNQQYWNSLVFATQDWESDTIVYQDYGFIDGPYGGFALYNYNAQINVAELKRLINLKFTVHADTFLQEFKRKYKIKETDEWTSTIQEKYEKFVSTKIKALKTWFWKRGVLVVEVNGTC